ncbi:hypothetical protein C8J56DRAFT_1057952 [Mycena floridula]|nr:hypothetical protein C8J56DRAFT_1057952 [Mycena floridula]
MPALRPSAYRRVSFAIPVFVLACGQLFPWLGIMVPGSQCYPDHLAPSAALFFLVIDILINLIGFEEWTGLFDFMSIDNLEVLFAWSFVLALFWLPYLWSGLLSVIVFSTMFFLLPQFN